MKKKEKGKKKNVTFHALLRKNGCWGKNIKTEDLGKK